MKRINNYSKLAFAAFSFFIFNFSIIPHSYAGIKGSNLTGKNFSGNICSLSVSMDSTNITCYGVNSGTATANPFNGTSPYTYNWTPGNLTSQTISGLSAGTYTVTVQDANSCVVTASVSITQPVRFIYISTGIYNNVTCNGGTNGKASVTPVGGNLPYTYSWTNSAHTVVSTIQTPATLTADTYTVTVADNCGVTHTGTVTISETTAVSSSLVSSFNPGCYGGSGGYATATGLGGAGDYSYLWNPGHIAAATASGLRAGSYTVTVADKYGCSATNSLVVNITQPAQLLESMVSITNAFCYTGHGSATVNITGGNPPYTYLWTRSSCSTPTCNTLLPGTDTITVKDIYHCPVTPIIFTVFSPAKLVATKGSTQVYGNASNCNGTAWATMSGGISPYTYSWSPGGQTSSTITGLCTGSYCCTITDNNGCIDTTCLNISFTTGTQNISGSSSITIYPDHTNGSLTISGLQVGQSAVLFNYAGQMLSTTQVTQPTMNINISDKANGVYILRILSKEGSLVSEKKVVKIQ